MDIIEVSTKRERREFIDLPKRLYRDDPYWVCPLDSEIENVFDPARNMLSATGWRSDGY
jgi:hypothetical protein